MGSIVWQLTLCLFWLDSALILLMNNSSTCLVTTGGQWYFPFWWKFSTQFKVRFNVWPIFTILTFRKSLKIFFWKNQPLPTKAVWPKYLWHYMTFKQSNIEFSYLRLSYQICFEQESFAKLVPNPLDWYRSKRLHKGQIFYDFLY